MKRRYQSQENENIDCTLLKKKHISSSMWDRQKESYITNDKNVSVWQRYKSTSPADIPAQTLISAMSAAILKHGDDPALCWEGQHAQVKKVDRANIPPSEMRECWDTWTWRQYGNEIETIARSSMAMGLQPGDACAVW